MSHKYAFKCSRCGSRFETDDASQGYCPKCVRERRKSLVPSGDECENVLRTLPGEKLVFVDPDAGYEPDRSQVTKLLKLGKTYVVESIRMGRNHTSIRLRGFNEPFNSVHFMREDDYIRRKTERKPRHRTLIPVIIPVPSSDPICDSPRAKLTFDDLEIGDYFIAFPVPGDNSGHGGYKGGHRLFLKTGKGYRVGVDPIEDNARTLTGNRSSIPADLEVVEIVF